MASGLSREMRLYLVQPGTQWVYSQNKYLANLQYSPYRQTNLGLLLVAALTPPEFKITFADERFGPIDLDGQYELVGIGGVSCHMSRGYAIADEFRRRGAHVVFGGVHATMAPEDVKRHADTVIVGEAEDTWPMFIRDFLDGCPKPFYRSTLPGQARLDAAPIPRYDLLDPKIYRSNVPIQVSRGCPHDCEFCLTPRKDGNKLRRKPLDQVLTEIDSIEAHFGSCHLAFVDDNMFTQRKPAKELLRALASRKRVRGWGAQTDISIGEDPELLELMHEAGCKLVVIGFESLNPATLQRMERRAWKGRYLGRYVELASNIQRHGIFISAAVVVGYDEDDVTVFDMIEQFLQDANIMIPQVAVAVPFPGTVFRERLQREDRLIASPWDRYGGFDAVFSTKQMTGTELIGQLEGLYRRLLGPDTLAEKMERLRTLRDSL